MGREQQKPGARDRTGQRDMETGTGEDSKSQSGLLTQNSKSLCTPAHVRTHPGSQALIHARTSICSHTQQHTLMLTCACTLLVTHSHTQEPHGLAEDQPESQGQILGRPGRRWGGHTGWPLCVSEGLFLGAQGLGPEADRDLVQKPRPQAEGQLAQGHTAP